MTSESNLDHCLQSSWQASDADREACLHTAANRVYRLVETDLRRMEQKERDAFFEVLPMLEDEVTALLDSAKQFREGIDLWRAKAQRAVSLIEEKQRKLALMVQDVSQNLNARSEALLLHQEQYLETAKYRCEVAARQAFAPAALSE